MVFFLFCQGMIIEWTIYILECVYNVSRRQTDTGENMTYYTKRSKKYGSIGVTKKVVLYLLVSSEKLNILLIGWTKRGMQEFIKIDYR